MQERAVYTKTNVIKTEMLWHMLERCENYSYKLLQQALKTGIMISSDII